MKKGRKRRAKEKKSTINLNNQKVYVKKYQPNQIKVDLTENLGQLEGLDDFDRQLLEDFICDNNLMDQDYDIYFDLDLENEENRDALIAEIEQTDEVQEIEDEAISNGLEIKNEENSDALIAEIEQTEEVQEIEDEAISNGLEIKNEENSDALIAEIEQTDEVQEIEDEAISNDLEIKNEENSDALKIEKENNYTIKIKVEETEDLPEKEEDEMNIFKSNSKIKNETFLKANQVFVDLLGMNILLTLDTEQLILFDQKIKPVFRGKLIVVSDGYVTLDPVYTKTSNGAFLKNIIPLSFPINSIVTFVEI